MKILNYLSIAAFSLSLVACGADDVAQDITDQIEDNVESQIEDNIDGVISDVTGTSTADVVGDWTCTDMSLPDMSGALDTITDEQQRQFMEMMLQQMEGMKASFISNAELHVNSDGSCSMQTLDMQGAVQMIDGTWELASDESYFIMSNPMSTDTFEVIELSSNTFVIGKAEQDMEVTMHWAK